MKGNRILEDIKSRLDITELISDYVELKKSGQNYKGLCPFHAEKTPSFMVSPGRQIFHCFGCGAGGDIVSFVMKRENYSFSESLQLLAKKAGIKLPDFTPDSKSADEKELLMLLQKKASLFFKANLDRSKIAKTYLAKRGLDPATIDAFSLGFAVREWHSLYNHLKSSGFKDPAILLSGLASSGDKGIYDTFRNRIIFPIFNIQGEPIAFGGRVMDDSLPKYLNSPETPLFKKGEALYGANTAKDEIRARDYAIIVEGYFDILMCCQHGFKNVIAPLGTALTSGHLQKLKRLTRKTLIVFDGDAAGISAARRSIPLLLEQGFTAKVLLLPEGDDPDSLLRVKGAQIFKALLARAKTPVSFLVSTAKGRKNETAREIIGMLSSVKDLILKNELIKELSEKADIREDIIIEEMKKSEKSSLRRQARDAKPLVRGILYDEEMLLLSAIISFPDRAGEIIRDIPIDAVQDPAVKNLLGKIKLIQDGIILDKILQVADDSEKSLVTKLSLEPGMDRENLDKNIEDCIKKFMYRKVDAQIRAASSAGDIKLLNTLLLEKQRLAKRT